MKHPEVKRSVIRRLFGESAVYGLGGVANQALAIVLVPIYVRQLGETNYGVVALINTTLSLAMLVVSLALPNAFFRSYLKEAVDARERAAVLSTTLGLRMAVSFVGLGVYALIAIPLTALLFGGETHLPAMLLIGPIVFFDSINLVPLSLLRAERRPGAYAVLAFSRAVLGSILIVVFVVGFDSGVIGLVIGSLCSSVVVAAAGFVHLARAGVLRFALNPRLARHMLTFALPLMPAGVAAWSLNLSDRYLIQAMLGEQAVAIYSSGYTVGLVINALAIAPLTLAWGAAYWEMARAGTARAAIPRVMVAYLVFASLMALTLSALGTDAIRILLTPGLEPGRYVVPFSAFAYVAYGAYAIGATGLNLESQTRWILLTMAVAATVNVALNLALIPLLGYMGAAVSTIAGYSLLAVATTSIAQRYYPLQWDLARSLGALLLAVVLAATALLGPDHVGWRLLCVVIYPPLLIVLRVVSRSDLDALRSFVPAGGR